MAEIDIEGREGVGVEDEAIHRGVRAGSSFVVGVIPVGLTIFFSMTQGCDSQDTWLKEKAKEKKGESALQNIRIYLRKKMRDPALCLLARLSTRRSNITPHSLGHGQADGQHNREVTAPNVFLPKRSLVNMIDEGLQTKTEAGRGANSRDSGPRTAASYSFVAWFQELEESQLYTSEESKMCIFGRGSAGGGHIRRCAGERIPAD